ncbi:MAG: alpha-1,2-fucosyltransferase, partial [Bacteroidetes bacterium]|nr:alpha-1,2-fucosyltransferase [Bacteroidota bacterium]
FTLRSQLPESSLEWKKQMIDCDSVAIHVRRGDYVANPVYQSFFGALPLTYYQVAVSEMKSKVANPKFFIFSDDVSWCQQNFAFIPDAKFIAHKASVKASEDLVLMSTCRHQIIANSTYSWWGAWLNTNVGKVVIAPKQWFANTFSDSPQPPYASRYYNTKDLLPESWIRL